MVKIPNISTRKNKTVGLVPKLPNFFPLLYSPVTLACYAEINGIHVQ